MPTEAGYMCIYNPRGLCHDEDANMYVKAIKGCAKLNFEKGAEGNISIYTAIITDLISRSRIRSNQSHF